MRKSDVFNVNLTYFVLAVSFVCIRILTSSGALDFMGESGNYIFNVVIQVGLMFLLPLFMISSLRKKTIKQTFNDCSFKRISFKEVMISIGIGLILFFINMIVSTVIAFILALLGYQQSSGSVVYTEPTVLNLFVSLIMTAVLPAFCEEFAHRGMLLSGYKVLGFKKAVLFSALLFGLIHLNINQFFFAIVGGIVLASVTLFSRSIIPAMIIHFMNNGINVYLDFSIARDLPLGNFYKALSIGIFGNGILSFILLIILIPILLYLLMILLRALLKINAEKSINNYMSRLAIDEIRKETLGEIATENKEMEDFKESLRVRNGFNPIKVEIPYEVLGFYMAPAIKPSKLDNLFFYSTLVLGSIITLFTFIWGIL